MSVVRVQSCTADNVIIELVFKLSLLVFVVRIVEMNLPSVVQAWLAEWGRRVLAEAAFEVLVQDTSEFLCCRTLVAVRLFQAPSLGRSRSLMMSGIGALV
jgi:hypothetical protein